MNKQTTSTCTDCREPVRLEGRIWVGNADDSAQCWSRDAVPCSVCNRGGNHNVEGCLSCDTGWVIPSHRTP